MEVGGRQVTLVLPDDVIEKIQKAAQRDSRTEDHIVTVAIREWERKLRAPKGR